jgi:hypothetical protein
MGLGSFIFHPGGVMPPRGGWGSDRLALVCGSAATSFAEPIGLGRSPSTSLGDLSLGDTTRPPGVSARRSGG